MKFITSSICIRLEINHLNLYNNILILCFCVFMCVFLCVYVCVCVRVCACSHSSHKHTHTHTHTYTHTHTHTQTHRIRILLYRWFMSRRIHILDVINFIPWCNLNLVLTLTNTDVNYHYYKNSLHTKLCIIYLLWQ
jgi:hypothetical protein